MKHEYLIAGAIIALFWWNSNGPQQSIPLPSETDEAAAMSRYGTSTKRSLTTYVRQFDRDLALMNRELFYGPDLRP